MYDRRTFLGAVSFGVAGLVAGCSSGSGGDEATVGETQTLGGLEFTVTGVTETTEVTGVDRPEPNGSNESTAETTRLTAGVNELGDQRRFLVVDLVAENTGEEARELPAPASPPPMAAGGISITGTGQGINPTTAGPRLLRDGEADESFGSRVADLDWSLPPGDSVAGWLLFRVGPDFSRETNYLTVGVGASRVRWRLAD